MREWLTKYSIAYDESDLKVDMMKKIKDAEPIKQYHTDVIAEKFTHKVLRLPVAHPELNPAWSVVKGYVAKHNKKFTLKEVEALVPQAINSVTPTMWKKFCEHTEKVENEYWKKDGLVEDVVEEILINVGDSSDDESSDEELQPDDDDQQYLKTIPVMSTTSPAAGEKPNCSKQLQLDNIFSL